MVLALPAPRRPAGIPSPVVRAGRSGPQHWTPAAAGRTAGTALAERPAPGVHALAVVGAGLVPVPAVHAVAAGPVPAPVVVAGVPVGAGWRRAGSWLAGGVTAAVLALLALQLRDAELGAAFAAVDLTAFAAGLGWFAVSMVAAAYTVTGFSPLPLRFGPTLLAQAAVGGLRLVVPAAAGMPAVIVRYLTRSGAGMADAAATVAAGQAAQLLATVAVVAALGATSGAGSGAGPDLPGGTVALVAAGAVAVLAGALWAAAAVSRTVRAGLAATWRGQAALAAHARRHPGQVALGVVASAALTLTHVLAFGACVSAAGGGLPLVTLAAIYLGAATAGSLIPAPGGIGPVEAALVAGLTAAGLALPAATAAALLSRLVSVWLPAVPGLAAAVVLRRRGLL